MYSLKEIKKFTHQNGEAWDEINPKHQLAKKERKEKFLNPDFLCPELDKYIQETLKEINIKEKDIIHLCCNDGEELISIKRLGAGRCIGVDISKEAIASAKQLAENLNIECEFICRDVYDIDKTFFSFFDVALLTVGALTWLPDKQRFFNLISNLLRTGGKLLIYEQHPFSWVVDKDLRLEPNSTYFDQSPSIGECQDYIGKQKHEGKTTYEFGYTLSGLVTTLLENNLKILKFKEFEHDLTNIKGHIVEAKIGFPLSYLLVAEK